MGLSMLLVKPHADYTGLGIMTKISHKHFIKMMFSANVEDVEYRTVTL